MKSAAYSILNSFLQKHSAKEQIDLLKPLSDKTKKELEKSRFLKKAINPKDFFPDNLLDDIHYSWFLPILKNFQEEEILYFISVLDEEKAKRIKTKLFIKKEISFLLTSTAKKFFKSFLLNKLLNSQMNFLPKAYLPSSPLNELLNFQKKDLLNLIDYLSLFDLIIQLRKTIDPKILKKTELFLSPEKKLFLKKNRNYKEKFSFPDLPLTQDISSKEEFETILHKRGLNRLAKAFNSKELDLIWYISRKLDTGRGESLYDFFKPKDEDEITKTVLSNILEVISFIKQNNKEI